MAVTVEGADAVTAPAWWRRVTERLAAMEPAALTLSGVVAAWVLVFAVLVVRRHDRFWDIDFDMGIHDQAIWLLAHGRAFVTVRGLSVFGHHFTPDYFLLVPAYWLGAGPNFLNVLQVVALALGAVPIYLLARERHLAPWVGAVLATAFLLHPALQFIGWELFHPEALAITPLLCAYLCAVRRSWRWFAFWAALALICKEDVALALVALGLLVAWRENRRVGLTTAAVALGWFLVVALVVMPAINGGTTHVEGLLSGVGGSPGGIVHTAVTDPTNITRRVFGSESGSFAWRLLLPFGLAPLFAPALLLLGLPQFLVDVLSDVPWTRAITFHYAALPLTALALAMVEGVAVLGRRLGNGVRFAAPLVVLACALYGTIAWGPSPLSVVYDQGWWPPGVDTRLAAERAAVATVPDGASVSASYTLVPHLSHRPEIYSFPNPWQARNWGVEGTPTRDPRRVDWLVVDRHVEGVMERALFGSLLKTGQFRTVLDRDDVVVARRVRG